LKYSKTLIIWPSVIQHSVLSNFFIYKSLLLHFFCILFPTKYRITLNVRHPRIQIASSFCMWVLGNKKLARWTFLKFETTQFFRGKKCVKLASYVSSNMVLFRCYFFITQLWTKLYI
jgi:hypothetical protein